jgi:two-component system response regulator VicR
MDDLKILIVEDDPNLGQILAEYLQVKGMQTALCKDGEEGLAAYLDGYFDLCILDIMMPRRMVSRWRLKSDAMMPIRQLFS